MHKVKNNLSPSRITEQFNWPNKHYELRNADFTIPRYNTLYDIVDHMYDTMVEIEYRRQRKTKLKSFKRNFSKKDYVTLLDNNCRNCILCSI